MTATSKAFRVRSTVFAPLGDASRAALVEQRLAEAIRSGLLADGERLPSESELAQLLGVATVTAREALVGLRSDGLVTTVRGRHGGSFVTRPSVADDTHLTEQLTSIPRTELFDRAALYLVAFCGVAELAAERADSSDIADLRTLDLDLDADVSTWRHNETEFALALAGIVRSAHLAREIVRLESEIGVLLRLALAEPSHRRRTAEHRQAVVAAVAANAGDLARAAARGYIDEAIKATMRYREGQL